MSHPSAPPTIRERIEAARQGKNPNVIARLESGWVIGFDDQLTNGYCLLMSDVLVKTLNDLSEPQRLVYLRDMARVGDAILAATGAARINYETWCNKDQALHTHIVPRYLDEPEDKRYLPVCKAYDAGKARKFSPQLDADFIRKMQAYLTRFA